jgi:hypothetical protein
VVVTKNFDLGRSKKFEQDMTLHTNTVSTANFLSGADVEILNEPTMNVGALC